MSVPSLARRASAEALGAFAVAFEGCGAIVTNTERAGTLGTVGVSLVFGLVILAGIAAVGHISGALSSSSREARARAASLPQRPDEAEDAHTTAARGESDRVATLRSYG